MSENLINGNEENYADATSGVAVVDVWAPWCAPCVAFAPTFEAAADNHPGITFVKVDADEQPAVAADLDVRSIPTIIIYNNGEVVHRHLGALSAARLDELIAAHIS